MLNILLIDDEPNLFRDILEAYGNDVDIASDGFQGIQILEKAEKIYDLVLLDVIMPVIDGWGVLKHIRNSHKYHRIPIIMLTSCKQNKSMITGLRRGADIYLPKPIEPGILIAHIDAISRRAKWQTDKQDESEKNDFLQDLLTRREKEVLKILAEGKSNQKIGEELIISTVTVKNHVVHILKKMKAHNRTQAASIFYKYMAVK